MGSTPPGPAYAPIPPSSQSFLQGHQATAGTLGGGGLWWLVGGFRGGKSSGIQHHMARSYDLSLWRKAAEGSLLDWLPLGVSSQATSPREQE